MSQLSPAEAVRQFDVSKPTLYSDMKDGKLSFSIDNRKRRKIDVSELQRLYQLRRQAAPEDNVNREPFHTVSNVKNTNETEVELLRKQIEFLEKEVAARKEDAERWQEAFDKAQDTAQKVTLLLEHHNKNDKPQKDDITEWQKAFKALDERIANQEKTVTEEKERASRILQQNKMLRKALDTEKQKLEEEKAKGFFEKLFG